MWRCGQLGSTTPRSLIQTIWYNNCLYFGMRIREEHYNLKMEDFRLEYDNAGRKHLCYTEVLTKTRNAGLHFKPRLIQPKMYATGGDECPVKAFEEFKMRRPLGMQNSGPLYLAVIEKPATGVWYKTSKMGVHTINNLLKSMKENSPLSQLIPEKRITNHSARKTCVRKLRAAGVPKCEVKNVTGHSTEKGLDPYDSGNEDDLQKLSSVISGIPQRAIADTGKQNFLSVLTGIADLTSGRREEINF